MERIRRYGLFFPLAFIVWMIGLILGLSQWGIIIAAIIIPVVIIYFLPKEQSEIEAARQAEAAALQPGQPAQAQQSTRYVKIKSKILGAGGFLLVVIVPVVLLVSLLALYSPWPDEIITFNSQDDLNKTKNISGSWKVVNGILEGSGQFDIVGSENWDLGIVEIVPSENFPNELITYVGPKYKIRNFLDSPRNNWRTYNQSGSFYRAEFFLIEGDKDTPMSGVSTPKEPEKKDNTPYPIQIKRMSFWKWYGSIVGLWNDRSDPEVRINGKFLMSSSRNDQYPEFRGIVSIYSKDTVSIKEVKYFCGGLTCKMKHLFSIQNLF